MATEEVVNKVDETTELVDNESVDGYDEVNAAGHKMNRLEAKARKAISKLNLTPVTGINQVFLTRARVQNFVIEKPTIYKSPTSDTYVIFGEPKYQDAMSQNLRKLTSQLGGAEAPAIPNAAGEATSAAAEVDNSEFPEKDIELILSQVEVPRAKAIEALKEANGDVVSAILALSS